MPIMPIIYAPTQHNLCEMHDFTFSFKFVVELRQFLISRKQKTSHNPNYRAFFTHNLFLCRDFKLILRYLLYVPKDILINQHLGQIRNEIDSLNTLYGLFDKKKVGFFLLFQCFFHVEDRKWHFFHVHWPKQVRFFHFR